MIGSETMVPLVLSEPRCKVCRSEHRAMIDAMLRDGTPHTEVRQRVNGLLGHEYFTPNNVSVHARKHLYGTDPAEWLRKSARAQRVLGDPSAVPVQTRPEDALRAVVEVGLRSIDAGVSVPEPGDVIRAARELKRIELDGERATEEQMLREVKAFTTAVKRVVPEEMWDAVYAEYEAVLTESTPKTPGAQ
jgi:hypothetical protein